MPDFEVEQSRRAALGSAPKKPNGYKFSKELRGLQVGKTERFLADYGPDELTWVSSGSVGHALDKS